MYLLYSALLAAGLLLTLPYWLLQRFRHDKYRAGFAERLGRVPARLLQVRPAIWVHAVSVGEVLAVASLVAELSRSYPHHRVVISTTTDTGQQLARDRFGADNVFYFPLDFAFAIRPYLRVLRPELVVIAETEFWPNFLRLSHASGARIAVVNSRISDRSWPGYRRFRFLLRRVLHNVDLFLAQGEEDARRLKTIGAPADRVHVGGNLKYEMPAATDLPIVHKLRDAIALSHAGPILVCGSTVEGEEPILLQAFRGILDKYPQAAMILAPRRPERFDEVHALLQTTGLSVLRRSAWDGQSFAGGVLLLDTIGELASIYALADIAFVGGSLVPRGGHNILEPAQHGVAILVGNHTENFRDIVGLFENRHAVHVVQADQLQFTIEQLLSDPAARAELGAAALATLREQTGATQRALAALHKLLPSSHATPTRSQRVRTQ
jgi:3-deoxy-D-manno-octulosonic-acid transferase